MALSPELLDAAKALGLFTEGGSFDPSWFEHVLQRLQGILTHPPQRDALLSLLDRLVPPAPLPGLAPGEKWHPLLGTQPQGNAYLTVRPVAAGVRLGVAGELHGAAAGGKPEAALRLHVPLVDFGAGAPQFAAGRADSPLALDLRVRLALRRGAPSNDPITLEAIRVALRWAPAASGNAAQPRLLIVLEGLGMDDGAATRDLTLDPATLGADAVAVVIALVRQQLAGIAPALAAAVQHLLGLLGFGDSAVPPLPLASLTQGPAGLQAWLAALLGGGHLDAWLAHLGGLFGSALAPVGAGTAADPARVRLLSLGGFGQLELGAAKADGRLHLSLGVSVAPTAPQKPARLDARATLVAIPLAGTAPALVLPAARLVVVAPGGAGPLVDQPGVITVQRLQAGVSWDGPTLQLKPLLELLDVTFNGVPRERIDLTHADAVADAVAAGLAGRLQSLLGGSAAPLLALIGLAPPQPAAGQPLPGAWPHALSLADFAHSPTAALRRFHRAVLADASSHWGFLLNELARLCGLAPGVAGQGTPASPWTVTLAEQGPMRLALAAWNDTPGDAVARLRVGLRLAAGPAPWHFAWRADVLGFDLPASGDGAVRLLGGQEASLALDSVPPALIDHAGIAADAFRVVLRWSPAAGLRAFARVENLRLSLGAENFPLGTLELPPPQPFDVTVPASLPLPLASLQRALSVLVYSGLRQWAGPAGEIAGGLLGLHGRLPGLPADWPLLWDPADPLRAFSDPAAAFAGWIDRLGAASGPDGPYLPRLAAWLAALLQQEQPGRSSDLAAQLPELAGAGVHADPWRLPMLGGPAAQRAELLLWLEPQGAPAPWAAAAALALAAAGSGTTLLRAARPLASLLPAVRELLAGASPESLGSGLDELSRELQDGDGFVPVGSQQPADGGWTLAPVLPEAAHTEQTRHPVLIGQALDQLAAWQPQAKRRIVLLLHPAFEDASAWSDFIAAANARDAGSFTAGAHLGLRQPGVDPLTIALDGLATISRIYTCDLQDDGSGNHALVAAQIDRVVARIEALVRPGEPAAQVFLVAHGTAGIAARLFAAAQPARVGGLVTIGTPHRGAPLSALRDGRQAAALRAAGRWLGALPAGPVKQALQALLAALDGWRAPATPGALPVAAVFPVGSFAPTDSVATGGVPALALGSRLGTPVFPLLRDGLAALAAGAGAGAVAPTHLGIGVQAAVGEQFDAAADARLVLRADLARLALRTGVQAPARPAQALQAQLVFEPRAGGYALGPAQAHLAIGQPVADVRARRLALVLRIERGAGGTLQARLDGEALDAAFHGPTMPRLTLDDALAAPVVGAVLDEVFNRPQAVGGWLDELGRSLQAVGVLAVNAQGRLGLAVESFNALRSPAALDFLRPRLAAALARPGGWLGLRPAAGGGFAFPIGPLALRAAPRAGGGFSLGLQASRNWNPSATPDGDDLRLDATFSLRSSDLAPDGQLSLRLGAVQLTADFAGRRLELAAPPWVEAPFTLVPLPSPAALQSLASTLLPRFLVSSGLSLLLRGLLGSEHRVAALDTLVADPVRFFGRGGGLGNGSGGIDAARVAALLQALGGALGQPGPGLQLPGGLRLSASGSSTLTLDLATTAPIGGVLGLALSLAIDELLHPHPGGGLSLNFPPAGAFPGLAVAFGLDGSGRVTLAVTPGGGPAIQLLPSFSGFGALAGAAASLLPQVLDAVESHLPASPVKTATLAVAGALELYDAGGRFSAHAEAWRALLTGGSIAGIGAALRGNFASAARDLLNLVIGGTPQFSAPGGLLTWTSPAIAGLGGSLTAQLGWDAGGPRFALGATQLKPAAAPVTLDFGGGFAGGVPTMSLSVGVALQPLIGIPATPGLAAEFGVGGLALRLRPFDIAAAAPLEIRLLPTPQLVAAPDLPLRLAERWLLPVVVQVLLRATQPQFGVRLWQPGGPTVKKLLQTAGLLAGDAPAPTLPDLPQLLIGLLQGLASGLSATIGTLQLGFSGDPGRLGARVSGRLPIPIGDYRLTLYAGDLPGGPRPDADRGLTLNLFALPSFDFQPQIKAVGLGLGFARKDDKPLVDSVVRLGEVAGFVSFVLPLSGSFATSGWAFEADIARFGLPLGQAGSAGGGNPVASSLLSSDGGVGGGDGQHVAPECDVRVGWRQAGDQFFLEIGGRSGALWLPVQKQFGPIYLEQLGVQTFDNGRQVGLLLDGGVKISGLAVQVDDLTLLIPLKNFGDASKWGLDLKGLAVALQAGVVKLSGGLLKNPGPPVSYDGALMVDVAGRGFTAIGSYARPKDALGEYVSFFVFVALPIPLGGPPFFFVTGLGGGLGLNRALLPPEDLNRITSFPLVAAMDNSALANDPMGALQQMGSSIPPRRGSFWIAAGVKFNTFAVVNSVAVLYVALDRGLDIGLLGLSRMALPSEDFAIAQIELALKARFSTSEGLLSVQAQLTDRSYLFHPSCQLTGGFAFFLWFKTGQFVLTLGGYHPAFQKPAAFPVVPRLGYRWSVSDAIVVKGESYFALTTTCVMAGGRLEASYRGGPVRAWFKSFWDVLVSWDPFYYSVSLGIEIGASVDTGLFGTVSVSLGAELLVEGPPLHGFVKVKIVIVTVRIPFGDPARDVPYIEQFAVFRGKYLTANDSREGVDAQVRSGLLPLDPPGGEPAPGTRDAPWVLGAEWSLETESALPANRFRWADDAADRVPAGLGGRIDLAPMGEGQATSSHRVRIRRRDGSALGFVLDVDRFVLKPVTGHFPESTWILPPDPRRIAAGARTIDRMSGLQVAGVAELVNRSAAIRITGAVDDLPQLARPLPFDQPADLIFVDIRQAGAAAVDVAVLAAGWTLPRRNQAVQVLLADAGFAAARQAVGVDGAGLSPLAQRELKSRSAPARVVPLSTGLSLDAPARPAPAAFAATPLQPVRLDAPRLLAVMRHRATPASGEPLSLHTSVATLRIAAGLPRTQPPRAPVLAGARLHRSAPPQAPAPTQLAHGARTLVHGGVGAAGPRHAQAFEAAGVAMMSGRGVTLPAGTTQLWELPQTDEDGRRRITLAIAGDSAARVVWLDRTGTVLQDLELPPAKLLRLPMPRGATALAISALGRVDGSPALQLPVRQAAVTQVLVPVGRVPAVGWQLGMQLEQVGPHTLLARGASLQTARPVDARQPRALSAGLVAAEQAVRDQQGVTTRLPATVTVVAVLLDAQDASAAADGDLGIAADGAVVALPPLAVPGGARRALLYDVRASAEATRRGWFGFGVASASGWRLAGVIGLTGSAADWADRLDGEVPPQWIASQALTADGELRARFIVSGVPGTTTVPPTAAVPRARRSRAKARS